MIDQLKDLKDTYETARQQIDRGKEPLEELLKLQNFLNALVEDPSIILEKVDKDYRRYVYDDFSMGLLKRLTRERSRDDKYLEVIGKILQSYMQLFIAFLKEGQLNPQFFDSIRFLFEFDSILHNYNYQIPEDQLKSLRSSNQEWRRELKEGDMVDAILDEMNSRCSGWSQAKISQVNGDLLHLEFIFDTKTADKFVDRWSVEVAQFETKTKDIWEWKSTIAINQMVDANDKTVWNKSTILDIKETMVAPGRNVKQALIGYRIYVENGTKSDEKGKFEGWSSRFDEWVSIYSPRIQPFFSKTQKGTQDDLDLDEDFDHLIQPVEGQKRVYAVPRLRKCISSLFITLINQFGNDGGFDIILQCLSKQDTEDENNTMDLNILATLIHCVSYPYLIYHKEFIHEYGPNFVELCIKCLREAPEKSLRDVRREKIESIIKSIDNFQRRLIPKDEREKQTEILKLEVSLMCLKSSFLERRIQGIKDLNQIIKNNRMFSNKNFTSSFLIEWMSNNGVFGILFDPKKTHLQLVQRCTDIFKLLLQENMFTPQLMEMFWSLAKSDYKFEVYKIINESSFYLKQEHIAYFFEQIKQVPAEKLAIEEFQCLSELGKYARDSDFKKSVTEFFWQIICNSEQYKDELVNNCITKFCEMVKQWDLKIKHDFFLGLTKNLQENKSSIPSLKLFKGLLKDQKDRTYNNFNSSPTKQSEETSIIQTDLTLPQSLDILINEQNLIKILLDNLYTYQQLAKSKLTPQMPVDNRKKLFIVSPKCSHNDEIDERLQFLKYIAQISTVYQVSKKELGVLYDLLVIDSVIPSDQEEFLTWCKSSCEQSTTQSQILDLNEVGEFFTEKMKSGALDVKNLLVVGFDFLQQYFLSVNETSQKLIKAAKPQKQSKMPSYGYTSISYGMNSSGVYGPKPPTYYNQGKKQDEDDSQKLPTFKLLTTPSELDQLDIVWNIALHCENPKVVPKAIDFLIRVYYSLDVDLDEQKIKIQDELIAKCISILKEESQDESIIKRVIDIVKNIIYEAEKKGTGDVKPHNALLKGELLERISIKNKASPKTANIMMSIYSNTTFWEFKKEVAKQLELAPKYLKLERGLGASQTIIKDIDNGKTLAELGFQSNDTITAYKINIEEEVPNAPLVGQDGQLSEKAKQIFNEWFSMYSDDNDQMTKETCAFFIKGCTGEYPGVNDDRIQNLFKSYDSNQDGKIERSEFMNFYLQAARTKPDTVRENLKAHNIRSDLKKLSEVQEESSFATEDMPRFKISKNQQYFDLLMSLLDRRGKVSDASWDLIQMLATNQELYTRVLQLKTAMNPETGKIEWAQFFDSNSVYKLLYTLQIVEAVMEEGEGEGLERIVIVDENEANKKKIPQAPPLPGAPQTQTSDQQETPQQDSQQTPASTEDPQIEEQQQQQLPKIDTVLLKKQSQLLNSEEDRNLRSEWTKMFLEHNGFQYILKVFMDKQIIEQSHSEFELKHIAFLLKLLRIFIMAAFSTSQEAQVYAVANLVRRSSSNYQEEELNNTYLQSQVQEGSRFKELQKLLDGPIGEEIIQQINYKELQQKILTIISQILVKSKLIFEDKLIVENALSLWVGCNLHMNELLNDFYSFTSDTAKNCDDFILSGLLFCEQEKVREEFKQSLSCLSHKLLQTEKVKEVPLYYLLKLLSQKFSIISQYHCKQYFELFCDLIDQYFMVKHLSQSAQEVFNPEELLALIIDKIKEYNKLASNPQQQLQITDGSTKVKESTAVENDDENSQGGELSEQENIYIGLIQLTGKIIDNFDISFSEKIVESKNLIDEIFVQFLFASVFKQEGKDSSENLKLKPKRGQRQEVKKQQYGKKSKDAAYKLLNTLIRKSPLLMNAFLEKSMFPLMGLIKKHTGWNYTPPGHSENRQKYVGLKNLGCICYMNSMLQQFFMIPSFRYNLLSVDDRLGEDLQEYKGHKVDDNVLHQLQKLMTSLELSERQDYNPFEFCFAFKDLDGNPTNTGEQKDAQEFLNLSFDRIENLLRNTTRKYLLQSVFGGQTCSQLVCQECGKVKNRIEDYYNLSLTVKDIKSMYDSLQKLIEGEVINDYECDSCKKKVDISKRILISQTPNVLIVHLQRIIFNFDTFRNDKINSFFDFPYHLDLKPYSFYEVMRKENRLNPHKNEDDEEPVVTEVKDDDNQWPEEEDCFEYKLVGVTVHSGTANAGHYWSYINTRRGYTEPDESDPAWSNTEGDPWMEFNDSTVRDFNFEKMKDECYGGDGKGGSDDAWSFGGSYGKSAYMLVYERKKKKPLKILATPEEIEESKDKLEFDPKKEEYYKMVNYRECAEDIAPNQIYKQVFEDNQKFEFENDIYSPEFFDFVKGILQAVLSLDSNTPDSHSELLSSVKSKALTIGKKTIMDLLAKCFYNTSIKYLVEALIDILKKDDTLCAEFLAQCFKEDNCSYLIEILLECTDSTARLHVGNLVKFILSRLKLSEKDYLYETQQVEVFNDKGEIVLVDEPKALSAKFILKCFSIMNSTVAKNWSRFENFMEILYVFAIGEETKNQQQLDPDEQQRLRQEELIGLEFFFRHRFIEKACDFLLGKKSPLSTPGEKRFEMGGSFNQPNFTPIIKIVTRMITNQELLDKYPLTELEKSMFLHHDLLKVMLGSPGSKQFGQCLANMCKDNIKMSQKVSKVFVKAINNSNFDNVKSYLSALKPFLRLNDSLKEQKLEWVFGFNQIIQRKTYKEEKYKYGLEFIDRISEEATTYVSPIASGVQEESLFTQLLKCKGKLDTFAINCLQEMLSLMSKDDVIARFVYNTAPQSYQTARYSDWIRPYLEYQKTEVERANSYAYFKNKHDAILKCLAYLEKFEEKIIQFKQEEKEEYEKAKQQYPNFEEVVAKDWLSYQHPEVIEHFPPQLIIGRQTTDDRELIVYDSDPLVKVVVYEVPCEYNYSNPTGWFNLSLPHLELKTNNYQTMSYTQFKMMQFEQERNANRQNVEDSETGHSTTDASDNETKDPQENQSSQSDVVEEPEIITRNWFDNKKEGMVVLKVLVTNKEKKKVTVKVSFKNSDNIYLPKSYFKEKFFDADTKCLCHLIKIDPRKGWGDLQLEVVATEKSSVPNAPTMGGNSRLLSGLTSIGIGAGFIGATTFIPCAHCKKLNDLGVEFCEACGEALNVEIGESVMDNYFGDQGSNSMY